MAGRLSTPRYCIQHSRHSKQDGWRLWDISVQLSGNIAVSSYNDNTKQTSIDVYSVRNSDSRDKPKIFYSKQFEKYSDEKWIHLDRLVSFIDDDVLVSCLGYKLELFQVSKDEVLRSRRVNGIAYCLSVREREIFIGFRESNKITVYDVIDLNEIKSIILQGIQDGYNPYDMTAIADRIFVCVGDGKEGSVRRSLIFEEQNGRILSELTKPTDTVNWYAGSITVCVTLGVLAVKWSQTLEGTQKGIDVIVFYSLFSENNSSFLIVEVKFGIERIRISDRGDRMVTGNQLTGEVKVYDMAEVFTYSHLKEKLASTLQTDECTRLANFFKITKDQTDTILSSGTPSKNILLALEEKGILQPYNNIDRLKEAFIELKINPFCFHIAEIYQKSRAQSTSYGRFLATLSGHLTASLPGDLCTYFNISYEKKSSITSSQNPGLSFLLTLDEMGIIKLAKVGALEQPFTEMELVQAIAKIHEYQSELEEAESMFQNMNELTEEGKKDLFIQCLQKKIKNWYETMTPVPWKKSCRWRSTDLFVGGGLILTDGKPKGTTANVDVDVKMTGIKMQYTKIFSHEKLESEIRIILEGDPGSGKTMLMSQLAYDWCQGRFREIEILILLPLKFVEQKTIVQAIKDFYFPENERLSVNDIENFLFDKTISRCLLLDGLEEYNGKVTEGEQSEVTKIMSKVKYPTCKVVISSRSDYAQNLPKCPILKIARFSDSERSSYIQKVFPDKPKTQIEVRKVIQDNPFILDLCSVPLLFVLVVHNIESMVKLRMGRLDRVAPFVKNMVDTLCPVGTLIRKTEELTLGYGKNKGTILEELAYNGLCRGHQQLYWQKDFIESTVTDSKEWIDSGVLVVEESSEVVSMMKRDQILSGITDAKTKDAVEVSSGAVAKTTSASTLGKGSDKDSETTSEPVDSKSQSETVITSGSTAKHFPLQVRFLHKIIQEWFAANHFAFTILKYRDKSLLERYVNEQLVFIDPSDLHFVLRFTVALYPPCCQLIIKYLLRGYRSKEGSIPEHIIDCIFLCFAEYDGEIRCSTLDAVAEVCKEEIVIIPENSRLLQQAKVRMLELASKCGILTRKLILSDIVESASDDGLEFTSGIMMEVLDTLEEIEIIDRNGILEEEDYTNVLKFVKNCALIKEACLNFPSEPPLVDKETVRHFGEDEKTVMWKLGSKETQTLNTTKGEWMVESEMCSLTSETDKDADFGWDENTILEAEGTVSTRGGVIEIQKTGVRLYIPQGALQEGMDPCTIHMKIIPPDISDKATTDFSSNSSVIVELLPDNLTFQHPVRLTLPHCYQLKEGEEHKATIFMSHHKEGTRPSWEEKADQPHHLTNTTCTILLDRLCSVKYDIDCRIVDAKRIQVYAAGRRISYLEKIYETVLGYYPDVPGGGLILRSNQSLVVASKQSFLFYNEGSESLKFLLKKVIPQEWKSHQVEENLKEIPFECIALDGEQSCSFVFLKTSQKPFIPMFIFRVLQGDRGVRLLDRPEVLKNLLDAENSSAARVSTHSQKFLQEPFPGDEKLDGTSLHAEAFIDKNGGTLFLCEADISLHVPAGALTHGCMLRITVPLDSKVSSYSDVLPRLTPLTICEPDDLHFQLPVKLTLPHCGVIKNPNNHTVTVQFGHKSNVSKEMTWVSEDAQYSLSEHYCSVFLNHFSGVDVGITSTEEKILRVIPYTKLGQSNNQVLTVWLCNDLESDFQMVMQSEEKNEGFPLDSYDTFRLRCVSELENKVKVCVETLEGSNWHPDENETTIGVKRLSISNKSKCNFRLISDGNDDESYMYFLLRVTQTVGDEKMETTFALRKRICDLKMPVKFRKPFSRNKQTSHLFPTDTKDSLRQYTAVVYMDPVKRVNDDVIITVWLSPFSSSTEMFQGLQEEQELQYKHQVDTENSFAIVDDNPAVVTKTQFLNGHWLLSPPEMKIETERIRFGSRAKFQFIGKRNKTNGSEYIELQVETFQVGEEKIRFITDVKLNQLLYEIRGRNIEERNASANEDHSNPSIEGAKSYESQINLLPSTSTTVTKRELKKEGAARNTPPNTPEKQLKRYCMILKKNLAGDWKDLGRCLDKLSENDIDSLSKVYKDDIEESIHQMLLLWRRRNGSSATLNILTEALNDIGRKDLAERALL